MAPRAPDDRLSRLTEAVIVATADLERSSVLQTLVDAATELAGARYGALGVLGAGGQLEEVVYSGAADEARAALGDLPAGRGTPVRVRGAVFGELYLTEQQPADEEHAEQDEGLVEAFAAIAGVAVENARLHDRARQRERVLEAVREVTLGLLAGQGADSVLSEVATRATALIGADLATIAVPSGEDDLELRVAEGEHAERLRGTVFPREPSVSGEVIRTGMAMHLDDAASDARASQPVVRLGEFGPVMFVPLSVRGQAFGTLLVANRRGGRPFTEDDQWLVDTFAAQASVAFEFGMARDQLERLSVVEERERFASDLHETVIGRLFALSLHVEGLNASVPYRTQQELRRALSEVVDELDVAIREIRGAIFAPDPLGRPAE